MATDLESFFLDSQASTILLECIELAHSEFSQTHRVVRNSTFNLTVQHEDLQTYLYIYYPLEIRSKGSFEDLDFGLTIKLGDLQGNLQKELELVSAADGFLEKPTLTLRQYRSDNYTLVSGPDVLVINDLKFNSEGAEFDATASLQNERATGRIYNVAEIPMMRALL